MSFNKLFNVIENENWNKNDQRIELPISIVEEICDEIEIPCAQVEVHPTHERLEVGLVWLNNYAK